MHKLNTFLLFFICLITLLSVKAQEGNDIALWNSIKIGYEPSKKWSFALETEFRLKDNISEVDEYFPELTITRKLVKGLKVGVGARYSWLNDNRGRIQGYENHFRFHADLNYKHDVGSLTLGYRIRYQNKNEIGISENDGDFHIQRIRLRAGIEYNIPNWKLDPEISSEIFSRFEQGVDSEFDKYRITLGTSHKIKKGGKIAGFYRLERDIPIINRTTTFIIGIKYSYTFD